MTAGSRLHAQNQSKSASIGKEFKPGEKVEISGIYDVLHDKLDGDDHADIHQVTIIAGTVFPHCKACRQWVKFRLSQEAEFIGIDPQFQC